MFKKNTPVKTPDGNGIIIQEYDGICTVLLDDYSSKDYEFSYLVEIPPPWSKSLMSETTKEIILYSFKPCVENNSDEGEELYQEVITPEFKEKFIKEYLNKIKEKEAFIFQRGLDRDREKRIAYEIANWKCAPKFEERKNILMNSKIWYIKSITLEMERVQLEIDNDKACDIEQEYKDIVSYWSNERKKESFVEDIKQRELYEEVKLSLSQYNLVKEDGQ